jgi:gluconolactonase
MKLRVLLILIIALQMWACGNSGPEKTENSDTTNTNDRKPEDVTVIAAIKIGKSEGNQLIDTTAIVEELGKGFAWSEGPVWVDSLDAVLFSDVPVNKIYKWSENGGLSVFMEKSGYTNPLNENDQEGSNGLMLDANGNLILCQHGDRRIAKLISGLKNPKKEFSTLVDKYKGKRFNSPNDLAIKSDGSIYFTDPSYGIKDQSKREINFHGVYKLSANGEVAMLLDSLTWPNGIAFSKDEKTIYIANSDPEKAVWYAYDIDSKGILKNGKIFFDATEMRKKGETGLPDGLKVHKSGTLFATGPGGVYILSPKGEKLGIIKTSKATANCAFDSDQKYLYMTTTDRLLRVKLK